VTASPGVSKIGSIVDPMAAAVCDPGVAGTKRLAQHGTTPPTEIEAPLACNPVAFAAPN